MWNGCIWINTYHHIALCLLHGHLPNTVRLLAGYEMEKKYSTGHLSISFEGLVEHIKNKAQCQKNTSEKLICVSVQWPLERSLMEMSSDLIYSSALWPLKTFHLVTNAKRHELHKNFLMVQNLCLWYNVRWITFVFFFKGLKTEVRSFKRSLQIHIFCEPSHSTQAKLHQHD